MPILEITQEADVGLGSFYDHFETKEQLFDAAVEAVMDAYGELLDHLTADIEDPAEVFACSFRLTGRLNRSEPELSRVLLNNALRLLSADNGLAPAPAATSPPQWPLAASTWPTSTSRSRWRPAVDRPRPAAPRPARPRRRRDHRPHHRGPAAHVRRLPPAGAPICSRPLPDLDAVGDNG